jgi:hypothetical protein
MNVPIVPNIPTMTLVEKENPTIPALCKLANRPPAAVIGVCVK